jgi:hypothetical protein
MSTMKALPPEIIQRVLSFFLSDNLVHREKGEQVNEKTSSTSILRHVDGTSLRAVSLVCKHLYAAVNSRSLWTTKTPRLYRALGNSLMNAEVNETSNKLEQSLIGFRKLDLLILPGEYSEVAYAVEERSTGDRWVLVISGKNGSLSPRHMKELYDFHFRYNESSFYSSPDKMLNRFRGRFAWGYRCDRHVDESMQRLEGFVQSIVMQPPELYTMARTSDDEHSSLIAHLLSVNVSCVSEVVRFRSWRQCWKKIQIWAQLVDWVVEVAEVLSQDDRTVFQAVAFFKCFAVSSQVSL